jgi:hypothetical protein
VSRRRNREKPPDPALPIPNPERAVIDSAKLRDYLLSRSHPVGRFKAAYFASLGYTQERWQDLEAGIRGHLGKSEVVQVEETT